MIMTNFKEKFIWMLVILVAGVILTTSCDNDDDEMDPVENEQNLVEVAQETSELSTLVNALTTAGLVDAFQGNGPLTVFAPSNAAFANVDADVLNNILANQDVLTDLLQYHVVSGNVLSSDLSTGPVTTVNGGMIDVEVSGAGVVLNGTSNVTTADIEASNGVIHIIDEVLIPEGFNGQTITQIAAGNEDFSILVDILSLPELSDLLAVASDPTSDLTVFAPNNTAFEAVLTALGKTSIDEMPAGLLKEIVQYHIVAGSALSTELSNGEFETLLEGESVEINVDGGVTINDVEVVVPDVQAINGVVHGIRSVLLPDYVVEAVGTVSEVFLFNPNYTILTEAVRTADLLSTLSTTQDITVFAPDNAAFEAAGITSLDGLTAEDLSPILLYHVVGARVFSTDLPADGVVETLNTENPNFYLGYLTDAVVLINGLTQITGVDIEKSNGVIHTIDRTLVPPAPNIVDIAAALADAGDASEFTVLVSLLTSDSLSGVAEALIASEDVTVFAPTDAAFAEISDVVPTLNQEQLTEILQYHAVGVRVFSTDLSNGMEVTMLNDEILIVNIDGTAVSLTDQSGGEDAIVTEVNIQGSNGVIHVIDKVLLPAL